MQQRPEFFDVLLDIAVEAELPSDSNPATKPPPDFHSAALPPKGVSMPIAEARSGRYSSPSRPCWPISPLASPKSPRRRSPPRRSSDRPGRRRPLRRPRRLDRSPTAWSPRRSRGDLDRLSRTPQRTARRALSQSSAAGAPNTTVRTSRRSISQALVAFNLERPIHERSRRRCRRARR